MQSTVLELIGGLVFTTQYELLQPLAMLKI